VRYVAFLRITGRTLHVAENAKPFAAARVERSR
jgi:hypothetical protein